MTESQQTTFQTGPWVGLYTDNLQQQWHWECPHTPTPDDGKHEIDEDVLEPYGSQGAAWMEWMLAAQFGSGLFGILAWPVYLVLGSVGYGYYTVRFIYGFFSTVSVQEYETPIDGTLEEDKAVYTWANFWDYVGRKFGFFDMLTVMGLFNMAFPITNLWTMPMLGLAAQYNELY